MEGAAAGDDWSTLVAGGGSADAFVFVSDKGLNSGTAVLDPIFKSASDVNEISTWNFVVADSTKPGALPPKDNTTNAYAAAYHNGDMFLFFGQDRFTANGTSDIGFWFLKSEVGLVPAGCTLNTAGCSGTFSGTHQVGDILVLSAFTNGGHVDTIEVLKWVGSGGNAGGGALQLVFRGTAVDCSDAAAAGAPACATVNQKDETAPWTYLAGETGSVASIFPQRHFFEGGINLTQLGLAGCFNTFLSETRSSSSLTAQLKDFAFGDFKVCKVGVEKNGPALSKIGDEADYSFTITNTGAAALVLKSAIDDKIGNLTATAQAAGCGSLAPGGSCSFGASHPIPSGASDPYVNTVTVVYSENATSSATFSATDHHSTNLFQPSMKIIKDADRALAKAGDPVTYTVRLSNTSSADTPDLECSISDSLFPAILNAIVTLKSGEDHEKIFTYTVQNGDPDPLVNSVDATCRVIGFSNVLSSSSANSVNLFQPSIKLEKTSDKTLSKVGDSAIGYSLKLTNTSSADTPNLVCTIKDDLVGLNESVTLASGAIGQWNPSRPAKSGDPDPLVNTATVECTPIGFTNKINDSTAHSVNLFQPEIALEMTGDALSKIGDTANYGLTLVNKSSLDTPDLECTITAAFGTFSESPVITLASGTSKQLGISHPVGSGDADPLVNSAVATCTPAGFTNTVASNAAATVNLFQPKIAVAMDADALSKIGDVAHYGFTVINLSSADTPDLLCTASAAIGSFSGSPAFTLPPGASQQLDINHTVTSADPDPLGNAAGVSCTVSGFPNTLTDSAGATVNLFQPSIAMIKGGPAFSKEGDTPQFAITVTNTSSADTPPLTCVISDPLAGVNKTNVVLASGESDQTLATMTVPSGAPEIMVNAASASCDVAGFTNKLTTNSNSTTDVLHPNFTVSQVCVSEPVAPGGIAQFRLILTNTGDADLVFGVDNTAALNINGTFTIAAGSSALTLIGAVTAPAGSTTVSNTATVQIGLDPRYGLPNKFNAATTASCQVVREGCTPGSWKNPNGRLQLWNQPTDPLAIKVGFFTGTSFHAYFGVSPSVTGLPSTLTMEGAINLGGGGVEKLARHGVAALLSAGSGLNILYPPGTSDVASLKAAITQALLTKTYEPLASQLAEANTGICPIQ